jgi:hypothetical protein
MTGAKQKTRAAFLAALVGVCAHSAAFAQAVTLEHKSGMSVVYVFKDSQAVSEFYSLRNDKVHETNPEEFKRLVVPLFACVVDAGTKAIRTGGGGMVTTNVLVVDGPDAGCRGVVTIESIKR